MDQSVKAIVFSLGGKLVDYAFNRITVRGGDTVEDRIAQINKVIESLPADTEELTETSTIAPETANEPPVLSNPRVASSVDSKKPSETPTTAETAQKAVKSTPRYSVSTEETISYQRKELSKELMLLEKHLQQKCKIAGKPCDCCEKHPTVIEALAQETLGMNGDPLFDEVAHWAIKVSPLTTEAASASGKYDKRYTELAVEARGLRKRIMGTDHNNSEVTNGEPGAN